MSARRVSNHAVEPAMAMTINPWHTHTKAEGTRAIISMDMPVKPIVRRQAKLRSIWAARKQGRAGYPAERACEPERKQLQIGVHSCWTRRERIEADSIQPQAERRFGEHDRYRNPCDHGEQ